MYYLLYDPDDHDYTIITSTKYFLGWYDDLNDLLSKPISNYVNCLDALKTKSTQEFVDNCRYTLLGTFTTLPTQTSHPELFI